MFRRILVLSIVCNLLLVVSSRDSKSQSIDSCCCALPFDPGFDVLAYVDSVVDLLKPDTSYRLEALVEIRTDGDQSEIIALGVDTSVFRGGVYHAVVPKAMVPKIRSLKTVKWVGEVQSVPAAWTNTIRSIPGHSDTGLDTFQLSGTVLGQSACEGYKPFFVLLLDPWTVMYHRDTIPAIVGCAPIDSAGQFEMEKLLPREYYGLAVFCPPDGGQASGSFAPGGAGECMRILVSPVEVGPDMMTRLTIDPDKRDSVVYSYPGKPIDFGDCYVNTGRPKALEIILESPRDHRFIEADSQ